jgi:hypothetical protein
MSQERDERMWQMANKLADTGEYGGWRDIEHELILQGYPRARLLLDGKRIRDELDRRCKAARERRSHA